MELRRITPASPADWNSRVAGAPGPATMFQTYEFGRAKEQAGWSPRFLTVGGVPVAVHTRTAPGFGKVWYAPKGPMVQTPDELARVLPALAAEARSDGAFLLKIEPELPESPENLAALEAMGLARAGRVQTNVSTTLVDVSGTPEDLMARLPSKTRNMIRRGQREEIEVELAPASTDSYERMWRLWSEVYEDQGLGHRGHDYQVSMWRTFCETGVGQLLFATHEGADLAGAFVTVVGDVACYRDGASLRQRTVPGASQLLQWEAMLWAQGRGATVYDLCGTPHSTKVDDKDDPFYGIGLFKRGFNKEVVDYVGALDLPLRPLRHRLWDRIGHRVVARMLARNGWASFY